MSVKKTLGQFYTTNYAYILQNMTIPPDVPIIEPFVGKGDLLGIVPPSHTVECYDIQPKVANATQRDTLLSPPDYAGKFILTNPPYLARNKCENKTIFDKYDANDLFKCFVKEIAGTNRCAGGIIIIPLNFWSSIRKADIALRKAFLDAYSVLQLNIFEEPVFADTSYTVCSLHFLAGAQEGPIPITVFPTKTTIVAQLSAENNFLIGGDIYKLKGDGRYKITRLTADNSQNTNILVKCIDDGARNRIGLSYVSQDKVYVDTTPNQSARTYATLVITPPIPSKKQKELVRSFNTLLSAHRERYGSLFLTNYRESKGSFARKRISFDLVYNLVGYILSQE
jgi:hypothetical protein